MQQEELVTIEWEGTDIVWVSVNPQWRAFAGLDVLRAALIAAVEDVRGVSLVRPSIDSTRKITWEEAVELGHLIREYNEQRGAQQQVMARHTNAPSTTRTRHSEATWRGGRLVNVVLDETWLADQTGQSLNEELTQLLSSAPPFERVTNEDALRESVARLERFWS